MERKNAWKKYSDDERTNVFEFAEGYRQFITKCKTERECTKEFVKKAEENGFKELGELIQNGKKLKAGDRVYAENMGKAMALFIVGSKPIEEGMNILGAHIDSPRLDIKQNPLYEDSDIAYLDTHYYGGVKKYQWVTMPLALHGVIIKKDLSCIEISIGEKDDEPVFCITDLLPHLAADQMEKKANKFINGEDLNVLIGNMPKPEDGGKSVDGTLVEDEDKATKDAVKNNILAILKDQLGMDEEDFLSAELEVVPAGPARDCGFDRSMIMGYGQDDRVCAYPSFMAMLDIDVPENTSVCLLVDKEEIGSVGATGMHSKFFENCVAEMINLTNDYSELKVRRAMTNSMMLSSDVSAAFDPNFASAFEKKNAAQFGRGLVFNKFTGARGKSGSNDANPEYIALLRDVMDKNNVAFQTAELGKVDQGGGGTIAYILANYGMKVIDSGVAVLSMHAPWEITSKADIFEAYKGYVAFLKDA